MPTIPIARFRCSWSAAAMAVAMLTGPACSTAGPPAAGTEPARATVVAFLDAIKAGDEDKALGFLTKLARARTTQRGISVAPPVSDTARYTVTECEMAESRDVVQVATAWTDVDEAGKPTTDTLVWALRLDADGWRIAGMAMQVFPDAPPLLLDFEDPDDMLRKQQEVMAELERRAKAEANAPARTARGAPNPPAPAR